MRLAFGNYQLDTSQFELQCNGKPQTVEPQVFDLLAYLATHRDRIISREELLDKLWAGKVVSESTLSSCIKAARQAVGDNGRDQNCIATLNRRGYRFVAETTALADDSTTDITANVETGSTCPPDQVPDRPSLAVMPFSHSQGNDAVAWAAEVLSEDISIQLARIPGFLVLSRNSTAHYRGREVSIQQIGRELGSHYVVEGSIWEAGNCLRVSVQLLETSSDRMLWADRTEVPANKLGEFQDEVVMKIISCIKPALNRAELSTLRKRRPVDLGAWALYRQGHAILGLKGWSEESFHESAELLRLAIAHDPELAFAHAYLALTLALGHVVGLVTGEGWRDEATAAAEKAIALDSLDSDVLGYVGCALADMGHHHRGIGMLQRSLELDPSNAQALAALGAAQIQIGEEEGIERIRQGMRISPRDSRLGAWGAVLARGLLNYNRVNEAINAADVACRCDDKIFLPRIMLTIARWVAGDLKGAKAAIQDARRTRPQLSIDDIKRFARAEEIDGLINAGLL